MSGRRFSRVALPVVGQRVMVRPCSEIGRVVAVDRRLGSADVHFPKLGKRWYPLGEVFDAEGLVPFGGAMLLLARGVRLEYVLPGPTAFSVKALHWDRGRAFVVFPNDHRLEVLPGAPRFREVARG